MIDSNIILQILRDYNRSLAGEVVSAFTEEKADIVAGKVKAVSEILALVSNALIPENKRGIL